MNTQKLFTALCAIVFAVTAFDAVAKCRKGSCSKRRQVAAAVVVRKASYTSPVKITGGCKGGSCSRRR